VNVGVMDSDDSCDAFTNASAAATAAVAASAANVYENGEGEGWEDD
jgi:hypothetical protein